MYILILGIRLRSVRSAEAVREGLGSATPGRTLPANRWLNRVARSAHFIRVKSTGALLARRSCAKLTCSSYSHFFSWVWKWVRNGLTPPRWRLGSWHEHSIDHSYMGHTEKFDSANGWVPLAACSNWQADEGTRRFSSHLQASVVGLSICCRLSPHVSPLTGRFHSSVSSSQHRRLRIRPRIPPRPQILLRPQIPFRPFCFIH
jgi:hypothetical protein